MVREVGSHCAGEDGAPLSKTLESKTSLLSTEIKEPLGNKKSENQNTNPSHVEYESYQNLADNPEQFKFQ